MEEVKEATEERSSNHEVSMESLSLNHETENNFNDTSQISVDIKTSNDDEVIKLRIL